MLGVRSRVVPAIYLSYAHLQSPAINYVLLVAMSQPAETKSDRCDTEQTMNEQTGPISKHRQKRILDRQINHKAVEINRAMKAVIDKGAEELDISPAELTQRFAVVAPVGERRVAMWWNGLVSDRAAAWKDEYDGPKKQYLAWVSKRIKEDDQFKNLSNEEKEKYAKLAAQKRVETKETKSAAVTRKKVVESASEELEAVHQEHLNIKLGVEFALFATCGSIKDNLQPLYISSNKAETFLEGHMKLPPKELLTLMDLWCIGGVAGVSAQFKNKKSALGHSVRSKLHSAFCRAIENLGHDTSDFRHIQYKNYDKIINEYCIVLRGYPLTPDGSIVQPSDFPGGIKGLMHADEQLASGAWGFEKISNAAYKDWKSKCKLAEDGNQDKPDPPYIPVPGTEFKKGPSGDKTGVAGGGPRSCKCKANAELQKEYDAKQSKAGKNGGKAATKGGSKFKSRERIEDSTSGSEEEFDGGESDEEESDEEESDEEESDEEESDEEEPSEEESDGSTDN
ncbi:hypothetical protein FRC08_004994 [Ceratobasidium sp. 394]|nr:hypothetical protein FRC08_004994 [Ceratobasidium sp. 394]